MLKTEPRALNKISTFLDVDIMLWKEWEKAQNYQSTNMSWERIRFFFPWMTRCEVRESTIKMHILKVMINRMWILLYTHQWIVESGSKIFKALRRVLRQYKNGLNIYLDYVCVYCNSLDRETDIKVFSEKMNVLNIARVEWRNLGFWGWRRRWNDFEAYIWMNNRRLVIPKWDREKNIGILF